MIGAFGSNDEVEVSAKLTIPAAAGGLMLGRGGANIRSLGEESGAKVQMNGKDEALLTQERVVTISGGAGACIKCTDLIIQRLSEAPETVGYVNRGTSYGINAAFGMPMGYGTPYGVFNPGMGMGPAGGGMKRGYPNGNSNIGGNNGAPRPNNFRHGNQQMQQQQMQQQQMQMQGGAEMNGGAPAAETTITLSVPDELVGNILGKQGVTMREIISLSGAKVTVSPRGEFVEGTTNRVVTICGSPVCAQTAHMFITQRLQTPANPRRAPAPAPAPARAEEA